MKILLLAGGISKERQVSLDSGKSVFESLIRQEHTVFAIDPANNKSLVGNDNLFIDFKNNNSANSTSPKKSDLRSLANTIGSPGFHDIDLVFITLHGGIGENGTIQSLLSLAEKHYTGSNMIASAIAMDKAISKSLFKSESIPTPVWSLFRLNTEEISNEIINSIKETHTFPVIVKPNDGGSTLGISKVSSPEELIKAFEKALTDSPNILVEDFISGRELTVAILDEHIFPVVEIKTSNELYDYQAKYTHGKSTYIVPADIDSDTTKELQDSARKVYDIIGAAGMARIDFILDEKTNCYCLELNTLPGMTDLSLAPMAAKASGIDFDKLIGMIIESGLK